MGYLFGANAESIQGYIFATNKLAEVIGASEAVKAFSNEEKLQGVLDGAKAEIRQAAAGGVKIFFEDENEAQRFVRNFAKNMAENYPGLMFSQAGVKTSAVTDESLKILSSRLNEAKMRPASRVPAPMMAAAAPRTGESAFKRAKDGELIDEATAAKQKLFDGVHQMARSISETASFPRDIDEIASERGWVAVIHADGNGLGQVIRSKKPEELKGFSKALDAATTAAVKSAFEAVFGDAPSPKFRPIIMGGDDITVICDADRALEFAGKLCETFENETAAKCGRLTLCAGIAFVKAHYPFWMGHELAEELCGAAKKVSKANPEGDLPPSSLAFHFVGSSFHRGLESIVKEELKDRYFFGPYGAGASSKLPSLNALLDGVEFLRDKNEIKSKLRQLLTLWDSNQNAEVFVNRLREISPHEVKALENKMAALDRSLKLEGAKPAKTPLYDWVMLATHTAKENA